MSKLIMMSKNFLWVVFVMVIILLNFIMRFVKIIVCIVWNKVVFFWIEERLLLLLVNKLIVINVSKILLINCRNGMLSK